MKNSVDKERSIDEDLDMSREDGQNKQKKVQREDSILIGELPVFKSPVKSSRVEMSFDKGDLNQMILELETLSSKAKKSDDSSDTEDYFDSLDILMELNIKYDMPVDWKKFTENLDGQVDRKDLIEVFAKLVEDVIKERTIL